MKSKITFHDMKMELPTKNGERAVGYDEVLYIECDKPYCVIYCSGGAKLTVQASLQIFLDNLPRAFFRCNRTVIVSFAHYKEYDRDSLTLTMADDRKFSLSRRKIAEFADAKEKLRRISPLCPSCHTCGNGECVSRAVFCRLCNENFKV